MSLTTLQPLQQTQTPSKNLGLGLRVASLLMLASPVCGQFRCSQTQRMPS